MSYLKQVLDLRNQLHKNIVQLGIKIAGAADDLQLELLDPIDNICFQVNEDLHTRTAIRYRLLGLDCTTGELLAETYDHERRRLKYNDLTLEQLAEFHDRLETKNYTVKEKALCY